MIGRPWRLDEVSQALAEAQRQLKDITARDLIGWAALNRGTDTDQLALSYALIAAAHRAAGELDEYTAWQQHWHGLASGGTVADEPAWSRQARLVNDPSYLGLGMRDIPRKPDGLGGGAPLRRVSGRENSPLFSSAQHRNALLSAARAASALGMPSPPA